MSLSSKAKKVKPKGTVRELKLVHTIGHRGADIIKAEEVNAPQRSLPTTPSTSQYNQSSSPVKRARMDIFDSEPIPCNLEDSDKSKKCQTLVSILLLRPTAISDKVQGQNDFLKQFINKEKVYLNHLLNLETPPTNLMCSACGQIEAGFGCLDCYGLNWWCQSCLIERHAQHPFHRPQQWINGSFENLSLRDLGYIFLLSHSGSGGSCPNDENLFGDRQMTVIHVNGVFQ